MVSDYIPQGKLSGLYGLPLFSIESFHALHLRLDRGQSYIRLFDTVLSTDVTVSPKGAPKGAIRQPDPFSYVCSMALA